MHFDREALGGIYLALDSADKLDIWNACADLEFNADGHIDDACLPRLMEIMVEKGHIMPFEIPSHVIAAEEYDDIMLAMEVMT